MAINAGSVYSELILDASKYNAGLLAAEKQMQSFSSKMQDMGNKMQAMGSNLSKKLTLPIVGVGAIAAKIGMDFEAGMSQVQAISGASGNDLEALEAKAKKMGATTKFSASEAAEGLKYMAMAGWDTNQMLDGLDGVMMLAAASGEDLGMVSDIVTDALTAFGMEAAQAGEFADLLASASSNSNTNVAMMGETFKYVAPLFGALGYSAEDAALATGLMANAGIKASQAGTTLRGAVSRLVKPVGEAEKLIEEMGLSITDAKGEMLPFRDILVELRERFAGLTEDQQAQYAATIFGQEAMSGMLAIINASDEDFEKLTNATRDYNGAAKEMADTMEDNLKGQITDLKSGLEGLALQIYEHIKPALSTFIGWLQRLVDWLSNLSPATQTFIVVIAGLAAAIGPVLIALSLLVKSFGVVMGAVQTVAGVVPLLGKVFLALVSPAGLAVVAITGIITVGILIVKNWDSISAKLKSIWDSIKKTAEKVWNSLKDFFDKWGKTILLLATGPAGWAVLLAKQLGVNWDSIKNTAINIWNTIKSSLSNTWNSINSTASSVWNRIKEAIINPIRSAQSTLNSIITSIKNAFANMRITIPKPKLPHINVSSRSISVGGASVSIPKFDISWYAKGTDFAKGGWAVVGEEGPELLNIPRGSKVVPNNKLGGVGGGDIIIQQMNVRNDNDIRLIARELYNLQQQGARGRGLATT